MRFLSDLAFRIRVIVRRNAADRDLRDEFAHHRAMLVAELRAAGASAADAEREAGAAWRARPGRGKRRAMRGE